MVLGISVTGGIRGRLPGGVVRRVCAEERVAWSSRTREAVAPKLRSKLTEAAQTLSNQAGRGGTARTPHDVEMHRKAGHPVPPSAQPSNHPRDSTCPHTEQVSLARICRAAAILRPDSSQHATSGPSSWGQPKPFQWINEWQPWQNKLCV